MILCPKQDGVCHTFCTQLQVAHSILCAELMCSLFPDESDWIRAVVTWQLTVDISPPKKLGGLEKPQFFEDVYGYSEESSATHGIPWCAHPGLIFLCPFLLVSEVADSGLEPITSLKLGGSYKKWAWSEIDGPDVVEGFEYGNILQVLQAVDHLHSIVSEWSLWLLLWALPSFTAFATKVHLVARSRK